MATQSKAKRANHVGAFDEALKSLLHKDPGAFLRFGLGEPVGPRLRPVTLALPSRGRTMDGGYLGRYQGERCAYHLEFARRHQAKRELALDIVEAQARLSRREGVAVLSLLFDLYGHPDEPLLMDVDYQLGPKASDANGSRCCYRCVNLRGIAYQDLLQGPVVLWPLAPLTKDGVSEAVVAETSEAIRAAPLGPPQRADLLAALWFLAEAEKFPVKLLKAYIRESEMMRSETAKIIEQRGLERGLERGWRKGREEGEQRTREVQQQTIVTLLQVRLGTLPREVRTRVQRESRPQVLQRWYETALHLTDEVGARRLVVRIRAAKPVAARTARAR